MTLTCDELCSLCCEMRDGNSHLEQMVLVEEHGALIKPLGPHMRSGESRVNSYCRFCENESHFLIPDRERPSGMPPRGRKDMPFCWRCYTNIATAIETGTACGNRRYLDAARTHVFRDIDRAGCEVVDDLSELRL